MKAENFSIPMLMKMAHSPIYNYGIAGVTSWLIGMPSKAGTLRMFECSREQIDAITPHSHRFDFQCWVLRGSARNRIWREGYYEDSTIDLFTSSIITYGGEPGQYRKEVNSRGRWTYADTIYDAGECYSMKSHEVHSIYFARNSLILFFEGPTLADWSKVIEPCVDGELLPTMETKPWMFRKGVA